VTFYAGQVNVTLMLVMTSMLIVVDAVADTVFLHSRAIINEMQQLLFGK
jgi:hypothetical protein